MSVTKTIPPDPNPPKPAVTAEHRTYELRIYVPTNGFPRFVAYRQVVFRDEDGHVVEPPHSQPGSYEFPVEVTQELINEHPELAVLIGQIAAFVDAKDPQVA